VKSEFTEEYQMDNENKGDSSPEARGAKGGAARAEALSPEERSEIARKAAAARWGTGTGTGTPDAGMDDPEAEILEPSVAMPIARWRGALNIVGIEVPCYVLDNGTKIIGRTSATEVLTGIKGGGALEKYIGVKALEPFINKESVLERLIPFRLLEVEGLEKAVKGLPADLMIELCQGFVAALQASLASPDPTSTHPRLTDRQVQMALKASMFLSACAKVGLEALIDEATGYQYERPEDALQVKLRAFIAEELRAWEKTFPDELWLEFGRLTGWHGTLHSRPKWWGKLVIEMIYDTLDPDVAEYLKTHKPPPGIKWFQQLTDNYGARQLVSRCYEVIGMAKPCTNMRELRDKVAQHYGKKPIQYRLYIPMPDSGAQKGQSGA
jgi:P63C domain